MEHLQQEYFPALCRVSAVHNQPTNQTHRHHSECRGMKESKVFALSTDMSLFREVIRGSNGLSGLVANSDLNCLLLGSMDIISEWPWMAFTFSWPWWVVMTLAQRPYCAFPLPDSDSYSDYCTDSDSMQKCSTGTNSYGDSYANHRHFVS